MDPTEAGSNICRDGPGSISIDHFSTRDRCVGQRSENLRRGRQASSSLGRAYKRRVDPIELSLMAPKSERLLGQFFAIFDNHMHLMHLVEDSR